MKAKKKKPRKLDPLRKLISEAIDMAIADSWKGGNDPLDAPGTEYAYRAAIERLEAELLRMERDWDL